MSTSSQKCCSNCAEPRTREQFVRNHIKTHVSVPDDSTCPICWEAYGAQDLATGRRDVACQIVGLPGCTHVFGSACLHNVISSRSNCPLCRTPWFTIPNVVQDYGAIIEQDAHKDESARRYAEFYTTDYATARYDLYLEPEYAERASQLRLFELDTSIRFINLITKVLRTAELQTIVTQLREANPNPLDDRLYDPIHNCQAMHTRTDPLNFHNWHVFPHTLVYVVFWALRSVNGQRLKEMLNMRLLADLSAPAGREKSVDDSLVDVEQAWVE